MSFVRPKVVAGPTAVDPDADVMNEVANLVGGASRDQVRLLHEAGAVLLRKMEAGDGKYGKRLVSKIVRERNVSRSVLYQCLSLATAFTTSDIAELVAAKTAKGRHLKFNTIHALSLIPKPEKRIEVLAKTLADDLSGTAVKEPGGVPSKQRRKADATPPPSPGPAPQPLALKLEDLRSVELERAAAAHEGALHRLVGLAVEARDLALAISQSPMSIQLSVLGLYEDESLEALIVALRDDVVGGSQMIGSLATAMANRAKEVIDDRAKVQAERIRQGLVQQQTVNAGAPEVPVDLDDDDGEELVAEAR